MTVHPLDRFQEPMDPRLVAYDWEGSSIYEGDRYVETEHGYVLVDDIEFYLVSNNLIMIAEVDQ